MKKILGFTLIVMAFAFLPLQKVLAQANIVSFSIGGPNVNIILLNATDDNTPIMATIGNATIGPLTKGQSSTTSFGPFSRQGDIPILIHPCAATQKAYRANWPPDWATDMGNFSGLALTHEYLVSRPSENDIKHHIDGINHMLKGQPGGKTKEFELKEWFRLIDKAGITTEVVNCKEIKPIPAVAFNWAAWGFYYGDKATILTIAGSRESGYFIQNPPRWVQ